MQRGEGEEEGDVRGRGRRGGVGEGVAESIAPGTDALPKAGTEPRIPELAPFKGLCCVYAGIFKPHSFSLGWTNPPS